MEFFYASLVSLIVVFFSFFLHYILFKKKSSYVAGSGPLPPGQFGWPVIGETLTFFRTGQKGQPESFVYDRMNKYSTYIFKTNLLRQKTVVLCGAMANKFVFSNENKLVRGWWPNTITKILQPSEQTNHHAVSRKLNKFVHTVLRTEGLQQYIGAMDQVAQRHFETSWENKSKVVVYPLTKKYTFGVACKVFLSVEDPKQVEILAEHFNEVASGIFSVPIDVPGTTFNRGIKASIVIRKKIKDLVKQRKIDLAAAGKAAPVQDILSHMVLAKDENGELLEEHDISNMIFGLLIGGHDNPSSVCAIIVKYLAELPHIYEEVYKEQMEIAKSKAPGEFLNWDDLQKMKYSWNVACEVLRIAPPLQGTFREAIDDFVFDGFSVPKGWKIYWSVYSTHKNPECFPDPEKFDPSRFMGTGPAPYTFVPFGGGPRMCPGREYVRLEILVFMHNLMKRFKWEKIIPDEKIIVNPMAMPAKCLPIRLYPHDASDF
uniref:Uncharacterized protein n=1 Tax=Gentiana crassa subsp. rigescens TaxID=3097545 RepID=A0A0A7ADB0_9GENT